MWAMMEKLRMLFINKTLKTKSGRGGRRLAKPPGPDATGAIQKKRSVGGVAIPRRAPYRAREATVQRTEAFPKLPILPVFRGKSPDCGGWDRRYGGFGG